MCLDLGFGGKMASERELPLSRRRLTVPGMAIIVRAGIGRKGLHAARLHN